MQKCRLNRKTGNGKRMVKKDNVPIVFDELVLQNTQEDIYKIIN